MHIIEKLKLCAAVTSVLLSSHLAYASFVSARDSALRPDAVPLGSMAPNFSLKTASTDKLVNLAQLKGKPVVLIFGSGTCGFFTSHVKSIQRFYDVYKNRAHIFVIYTNEMHPGGYGGSPMTNNTYGMKSPFTFSDAKNSSERRKYACLVTNHFRLSVPVLLDSMDNRVNKAYNGSPVRVFILNSQGIVVFNDRDPQLLLAPDIKHHIN